MPAPPAEPLPATLAPNTLAAAPPRQPVRVKMTDRWPLGAILYAVSQNGSKFSGRVYGARFFARAAPKAHRVNPVAKPRLASPITLRTARDIKRGLMSDAPQSNHEPLPGSSPLASGAPPSALWIIL